MIVQLPADTTHFVEGLVASGQYLSAEEVVADGLRLLMSRQQLRAEIQIGIDELDAGMGIDGAQVFDELREHEQKLIRQNR